MRAKATRDSSIVGGGDGNTKEKVAECVPVDRWKCERARSSETQQSDSPADEWSLFSY